MNRKYFLIIINLVLVFSMSSGISVTGYQLPDQRKTVATVPIDLSFNVSRFVEDIISTLILEAEYDDDVLQGWQYRKNSSSSSDDRYYIGYQAGIAGIGDFLLTSYLNGFESSKPILDDTIDFFMTEYSNSLSEGIYWSRRTDAPSNGWTSQRYGVAGVLSFLSRAYSDYMNKPADLLDIMEQAYTWLLNQKNDEGYPMSPLGYITTGFEYGAMGIGLSMLDLYDATSDPSYLDDAKITADWIIDQGTVMEDALHIAWAANGEGTHFEDVRVSGYGAGIAGIVEYFLNLYDYSDDSTYLDAAISLGNDLIDLDLGGYWFNGSVDYITGLVHSNALTGYYVGSSGIAIKLLGLYDQTSNETYLSSAARAEKFIEYTSENTGLVDLGLDNDDSHYLGLSKGSAGIAQYYIDLYNRDGEQRYLDNIELILERIYSEFDNDATIIDVSDTSMGYSFNMDEGLAGIGMMLLNLLNAVPGSLNDNYQDLYSIAIANTVMANFTISDENELTPYIPYLVGIGSAFVLIVLFILRKKKKLFFKNKVPD
jgi:hypothetical protein